MLCNERNKERLGFKPVQIDNDMRINFTLVDWLPWDLLQIMLHVYMDIGYYQNVAIIPAYTAALAK